MTLEYSDADGERCMHVVRGGESHCENCGERVVPDARRRAEFADTRAQLWARVYASQFDVRVHQPDWHETGARYDATLVADAAVRDFDEHYLGGKK